MRYPAETDEAHPEVFTTLPPQPTEKKAGQLTKEQLKQFVDEGFVVIEDFFKKEELDPCKDAIAELVDDLANKLFKAGKIKNLHKDADVFERLILLEQEFPGTSVILHKTPILPQALVDVWANERLLNVAEQIVGPDILGNPNWNLRCKVPNNEESTVPWHQDAGYGDNSVYGVMQLGAWIPFLDANPTNGCMQYVRGGHRTGRVAKHVCCWKDTWYIILPEEEMEKTLGVDVSKDVVTAPVPYTGMILFNNLVPHRSTNNLSDKVRWSMDLRYQAPTGSTGFFGLKDAVTMRKANDPKHQIEWGSFNSVDRHRNAFEEAGEEFDELNTTICGPWMLKWEMVHKNRHTHAMEK